MPACFDPDACVDGINEEARNMPPIIDAIPAPSSPPSPEARFLTAAANRWHVGFKKAGRMIRIAKTFKGDAHRFKKQATCDTEECEAKEAKASGCVADVVKLWRRAELYHDTNAMYQLGVMYAKGSGVSKDLSQSAHYFARAAQRGHVKSQHELAVIFRVGRGVPKDSAAAVRLWEQAALQGHVGAQNNLAYMYKVGKGVHKDARMALKWFTTAASQGSIDAMYRIGEMYICSDQSLAEKWLEKAARLGHVQARLKLAAAHTRRRGRRAAVFQPPSSSNQQIKEHIASAFKGDADAQFNIGVLYAFGVDEDHRECDDALAIQWFSTAAKSGHANAQCCLAFMYEHGRGVPQNNQIAIEWYVRAAAQGQMLAKENLEDLLETQQASNKWAVIKKDNQDRIPTKPRSLASRRHSDPKPHPGRRIRRLSEPAM